MFQTVCFKRFRAFLLFTVGHPRCAHIKIRRPKRTSKSSQGAHAIHSFSQYNLNIFLCKIDFVAAPSAPSLLKNCKKALVLQWFGRFHVGLVEAFKGTSKKHVLAHEGAKVVPRKRPNPLSFKRFLMFFGPAGARHVRRRRRRNIGWRQAAGWIAPRKKIRRSVPPPHSDLKASLHRKLRGNSIGDKASEEKLSVQGIYMF